MNTVRLDIEITIADVVPDEGIEFEQAVARVEGFLARNLPLVRFSTRAVPDAIRRSVVEGNFVLVNGNLFSAHRGMSRDN